MAVAMRQVVGILRLESGQEPEEVQDGDALSEQEYLLLKQAFQVTARRIRLNDERIVTAASWRDALLTEIRHFVDEQRAR